MSEGMHAPGLKRMKRGNGRVDLYWVADEKVVKLGYQPKTVRIFGEWPSQEVAFRCQVLQSEMLEWLAGVDPVIPKKDGPPPGTIAWICDAFENDEDSPFHDLRQASRKFYKTYLKYIQDHVAKEYLSDITGRDVRRWHRTWVEQYGDRSAYACIQTLRRVIHYGAELRDRDSLELAQVLSKTQFSAPARRSKRPTFEMIATLREVAHANGRSSIALATALQFELGLRQKDVIGEWVKQKDGTERWDWGLTWDHIDKDLILRKPTSKSNGTEVAEYDLRHVPEILLEFGKIGSAKREGPLVIDENTGRPWTQTNFSRKFRKIARLAGWPDDVRNMDSRAGAVSEAFSAGATVADVMSAATHTQLTTTMGYNRQRTEQTSRVTQARAASRTLKKDKA